MLRLFGWTTSSRHDVTSCVTDSVSKVGGYVLDAQRFSNAALMLRFQLMRSRCRDLAASLVDCSVHFDGESLNELMAEAERHAADRGDVTGTLHIRFVHNEPDLRIETPAVPG